MPHRRLGDLAAPLVIAGAGIFIQRHTLDQALLGFDSYASILTSRISDLGDLGGSFTEVMMDGRLPVGDFYRPLANLSLALDHALWGLEPFGFQLTSLLLFGVTIALLHAVARKLLGPGSWLGPALAAAFYALHPSALSVLPFVARRSETLMLLFTLLALLASPMTPGRVSWRRHLVAGLCAMLALGSKETGVIAVGLVFCMQAIFAPVRGSAERLRQALRATLWPAGLALLALAARSAVIGGLGGYHAGPEQTYLAKLAGFTPRSLSAALCPGLFDDPAWRAIAAAVVALAIAALVTRLLRAGCASGDAALRRSAGLSLFALVWLAAALGLAAVSMQWSPRYLMHMSMVVGLLMGALAEGTLRLARSHGRARTWPAVASGIALLAIVVTGVQGSPLYAAYPEFAEASAIQTRLLAELERKLASAPPGTRVEVDLRRRVSTAGTAVDHAWGLAPWSLEAWLELKYPDRRIDVELRRGARPREFVSVALVTHPAGSIE